MAKEAYYFSHDYDPTGDPKMGAMLGEYGGMGYGCFWRITEMLHSEETHRLPLKKYIFIAIAKQMLTSAEMIENFIKSCIEDYELFHSDGKIFWSKRVDRNLDKRALISEKRADAGRKGGISKAIAKQNIAIAKQNVAKERKGKEIYNEYSFFDSVFSDVWKSYLEMRISIRKKATKNAEKLVLNKLQDMTKGNKELAIKIVEQSIENSWQGVFPLRTETNKPQQQKFQIDYSNIGN